MVGTPSETTLLVTDLTAGNYYEFKVEARNIYGYSDLSNTLTLLCAYIPEAPINVLTVIDGTNVKVSWDLVTQNGSPITAYNVYVKEIPTGTFTLESSDCVGTD